MNQRETLKEEIRKAFPDAEPARIFFGRHNLLLEETYGFTTENTRFAEGGCSDEINEPELVYMEGYWGERFKFGGLAGYCHGGKTGLAAVSHHVPEVDGRKNLLLLAGTHIGFHEGVWGKVPRRGQEGVTASCGALSAALAAGYPALKDKDLDPLDRQQFAVEQMMLPYLERCQEAGEEPDILAATHFLQHRIESDMALMVADLENSFDGLIALVTGITVNTAQGNFFSPGVVEIRGID